MMDFTEIFLTGCSVCEEFALSDLFVKGKEEPDGKSIMVTIEPKWFDSLIDRMPEPWYCQGFKKIDFESSEPGRKIKLTEVFWGLMYEDFPLEGMGEAA